MSIKIQDIISQYQNKLENLNSANYMLQVQEKIVQMECSFNYDMNGYDKGVIQPHYFTGQFNFDKDFSKVFSATLGEIFFDPNSVETKAKFQEYADLYYFRHKKDGTAAEVITETIRQPNGYLGALNQHDFFSEHLLPNHYLDGTNCKFQNIEGLIVDNNQRCVKFHGTFVAEYSGLEMVEIQPPFLEVTLTCSNPYMPFYKELLLDAYVHLTEKNYKMATFNAHAAFECFVNTQSKSENTAGRLINKFKQAYKTQPVHREKFTGFDTFTKLNTFYTNELLEKVRNDIAHGNTDSDFWQDQAGVITATKMYVFTSLVILCYDQSFKNFKDFEWHMKMKSLNP